MDSLNENESSAASEKPESKNLIWPEIPFKQKLGAIDDPLEFRANKSSLNARLLRKHTHTFTHEFWIDKHYQNRHQFGNDDGEKREGIEPAVVEDLVKRAFIFLMCFSGLVKGFHFINHEAKPPVRILLQENNAEGTLNVPIEAHFLETGKIEITVKTAMQTDNFLMQAGQYVVEIQEDSAILKKFDNGKLSTIYKI